MENVTEYRLGNGIPVFFKKNPNTPRTSISIMINGGNYCEHKTGISDFTGRLLTKGTQRRNSQDISRELDENAIGLSVDVRQDFIRIGSVFLNEDLEKAADLLFDILQNPTFELFERERKLFKGQLEAELDSPRAKASDNLNKTMYPGHPYGVVTSKILESLDNYSPADVLRYYRETIHADNISIFMVGPQENKTIFALIEHHAQNIGQASSAEEETIVALPSLSRSKLVTHAKEDAAQAQIFRGWYMPPVTHEDFIPLAIMSNILGSFGLSSRLFLELRDKKGLAYSVNCSLESLRYRGNFITYIGTEPKNIETALQGFDEEIEKIVNETVSAEELQGAQRNILGKREILNETNSQQCYFLGLYYTMGVGINFDQEYRKRVKQVSQEDILAVAQRYLRRNHITSILAPSAFLKQYQD